MLNVSKCEKALVKLRASKKEMDVLLAMGFEIEIDLLAQGWQSEWVSLGGNLKADVFRGLQASSFHELCQGSHLREQAERLFSERW
mmetsp:Transcript_40512/g.94798  ORF Transcript_40512/g.94798 Transcript_40512/m.94798 type:complete len:86 (+) Transcript_40512:149-406(+)